MISRNPVVLLFQPDLEMARRLNPDSCAMRLDSHGFHVRRCFDMFQLYQFIRRKAASSGRLIVVLLDGSFGDNCASAAGLRASRAENSASSRPDRMWSASAMSSAWRANSPMVSSDSATGA